MASTAMPNPMVVKELMDRIDAVSVRMSAARPCEIALEVETMRRMARDNGIRPALTVLHAIDSALARGERGVLVRGWLDILRDAVGYGDDQDAETLFAAACSVRLNG
ncbi:hypothetical protein GCM10023219_11040 [Stakelama sediminis]|uniref:Uncharacterized protein n=1 Tax=Stakelama sediminis TaxID=463200 RepID=A0A840YW00_9SPHN|nr:hypothetical protein [Stakelama sediminis]MBB5717828.1 hypothetical protein [Stakelama sediminis]